MRAVIHGYRDPDPGAMEVLTQLDTFAVPRLQSELVSARCVPTEVRIGRNSVVSNHAMTILSTSRLYDTVDSEGINTYVPSLGERFGPPVNDPLTFVTLYSRRRTRFNTYIYTPIDLNGRLFPAGNSPIVSLVIAYTAARQAISGDRFRLLGIARNKARVRAAIHVYVYCIDEGVVMHSKDVDRWCWMVDEREYYWISRFVWWWSLFEKGVEISPRRGTVPTGLILPSDCCEVPGA
jgi:hypothetical protein